MFRKILRQGLVREASAHSLRIRIHELQMAELMEEDVVEHQPAHCRGRPLAAANSPKLTGRLASSQATSEADAGRECAEGDFVAPTPYIPKTTLASAPIIEMHRFEPFRYGARQTLEDNANVLLRNEMAPIALGLMVRESDFSHRVVSVLSNMPM